MVPPTRRIPVTSLGTRRRDRLASIRPSKLSSRPMTSQLRLAADLTTARMTALRPGASPPPVSHPIRRRCDFSGADISFLSEVVRHCGYRPACVTTRWASGLRPDRPATTTSPTLVDPEFQLTRLTYIVLLPVPRVVLYTTLIHGTEGVAVHWQSAGWACTSIASGESPAPS